MYFLMVKFYLDSKNKIATEYLNGCGSTSLPKKYSISDETLILNCYIILIYME